MVRRARSVYPATLSPWIAVSTALFLALLMLTPAILPAGAQEHGNADRVLYLSELAGEPTNDRWNFTTFAPGPDDPGLERHADQRGIPTFAADWYWFLPRAPADWSVGQGDEWEFVLFIEGLDETLPLPGDWFDPKSSAGQHEIQIDILTSDTVYAKGSIRSALPEVGQDIRSFKVVVEFDDDYTFTPENGPDHFRIDISVTGHGLSQKSPLVLHFGSQDHPSHLDAPEYPWQALRAMENGPQEP